MRRMRTLGLIAALEDDSVVNPEVQPAELNAADSLETDLLEVQDSAADGEVQEQQVDEAVEVAEALESYQHAMESIVGQGGLDRNGAIMMNIGLEHLYARVGISVEQIGMPSLESYGGSSSRIDSTKVALEGIGEQIKKIWKAIIDAMKRAYAWVEDHFMKVFGAAEKLQKRAQAVGKAADEARSKKKKESSFESESLVKALYVGNAVPTDLASAVKNVEAVVKKYLVEDSKKIIDVSDDIIAGIEDPNAEAKINAIKIPAKGGLEKNVKASAEHGTADDTMKHFVGVELLGGKADVIRASETELTGVAALKAFSKFSAGIGVFNPNAKAPSTTKVNTLDAAAIEATAGVVESIGQDLQAFRKTKDTLKEILKKATAAAEKASKAIEAEGDAAKKENLKAVQSASGNFAKYIVSPFASVANYSLSVSKSVLDYCELSLKQYEAK